MNREIVIVADSTCDLSKDIIDKNKIVILPLAVCFDDKSYHDGVDITTEKLYEIIDEKNVLPKTAAITPGELMTCFNKIIADGKDIIFISISAKMSKTNENAILVAQEIDQSRIRIIDSKNLSTGIGLLVLKAVKFRDQGFSLNEIAVKLLDIVPRVRSQFAIETMEYLHKGGRCSSLAKFIGSLLKLKPIIVVRDGVMSVGKKPLGKMKVALDTMLKMLEKDQGNVDLDQIFITHSISPESAIYLNQKLKEMYPNVNIIETVAGCVISSHCGRGTIGILYILNENKGA